MGKVLQFRPRNQPVKLESVPKDSLQERIERIKASITRINELMAELKGQKPQ